MGYGHGLGLVCLRVQVLLSVYVLQMQTCAWAIALRAHTAD